MRIIRNQAIKYAPYAIVGLGLILRSRQFLTFRSFWLDESFLILNLRDRSYSELLDPLKYNQVAPIGFLFSEKTLLAIFGLSEWGLRSLPLFAALLSLWLVYLVARELGDEIVGLAALAIFILPTGLTYYASEVKQYSTDVFFCLLVIWSYLHFTKYRRNTQLIMLILTGVFSVWFSSVAIIYLLSILVLEFIELLNKKQAYLKFGLLSLIWLGAFASYYFLFIEGHPSRVGMENYWQAYFIPQSIESFKWLLVSFKSILSDSFAYNFEDSYAWIIAIILSLGSFFFYRIHKFKSLILILPVIIHLILSFLKLYPFGSRLVLYQMPLIIILIAGGLRYISVLFPYSKWLATAIYILITLHPATEALNYFANPYYGEDMRASLEYIRDARKDGDGVYVFAASKFAFDVYQDYYFNDEVEVVIGEPYGDDKEAFVEQYESLSGNYWILFSHEHPPEGIKWIEHDLEQRQVLNEFKGQGSRAFLVEF